MRHRASAAHPCSTQPARRWTRSPKRPRSACANRRTCGKNPLLRFRQILKLIGERDVRQSEKTCPCHTPPRCSKCRLEIPAISNSSSPPAFLKPSFTAIYPESLLSNAVDQQQTNDNHHGAGYAMNGQCSRFRSARCQNDGHVAKRDNGFNE